MKLLVALSLAALPLAAQGLFPEPGRDPRLIIDVTVPGRVRAWLSMAEPVPERAAQHLAQAVGCPATDVFIESRRTVYVECAAPLHKDGARWSGHWDLDALNAVLRGYGAEAIDFFFYHPRSGFSVLRPTEIPRYRWAGYNVVYLGKLRLALFHDIYLEAGISKQQTWLLAAAAGAILLLPLLLFPARASGKLTAMASANALFWLAATMWLCVTLPLNVPAWVPLPWSLAIVSAPMLIAVWTGSRIAGGPRSGVLFWSGALSVALLSLAEGLLGQFDSVPWLTCCIAALAFCYWRLRRAYGRRLEPLGEGELFTRVRQLAERAHAKVRSVQLLVGGDNLPMAFGSRARGVFLSGGLLCALSRREVDAIVAHELSHVRRRNFVVPVMVFLLAGALVCACFVSSSFQWMPLLLPPVVLLRRAMRRGIERRADADAVTWSGDAEALITGLVRVTRAHGMPLEWPGWIKPLMPHPSTMERVCAAAAQAGIPDQRLTELLETSAAPPMDCYPISGSSAPTGSVFTPPCVVGLSGERVPKTPL